MLSNILAPLADGGKSQWPPTGVEAALSLWYDAVGRIRLQLIPWMEKQSKHIAVSGWWISDHLPLFLLYFMSLVIVRLRCVHSYLHKFHTLFDLTF